MVFSARNRRLTVAVVFALITALLLPMAAFARDGEGSGSRDGEATAQFIIEPPDVTPESNPGERRRRLLEWAAGLCIGELATGGPRVACAILVGGAISELVNPPAAAAPPARR